MKGATSTRFGHRIFVSAVLADLACLEQASKHEDGQATSSSMSDLRALQVHSPYFAGWMWTRTVWWSKERFFKVAPLGAE